MARSDVDASSRTAAALAAIDRFDHEVRAFCDIRKTEAGDDADALDRMPPSKRGMLHGVPIAIKEVFDVAGCRCSWGTPVHANRIPDADCDAVARIKLAGGVVIGTATSTEYAMARPAPTGNPYALERTPGASSSGSAAAVAAGFVDLALGSQTIGSGIRPAAYCGVIGLKPTQGVISLKGAMPLSAPLDHAVIMARKIDLVQDAFDVLTGQTTATTHDTNRMGKPGIALLEPWFSESVEARVWHLVASAVEHVTGSSPDRVAVPDIVAKNEQACLETILAADMWRNHGADAKVAGDVMSASLKAWLERGKSVGDEDYREALRQRTEFVDAVWSAFAGVDVIATVATVGVAPLRSEGTGSRAPQRLWSLIGCPAIAVPIGLVDGLPVAVQLIARPHHELALFTASRLFASHFSVPPPSMSFGDACLRHDALGTNQPKSPEMMGSPPR